MDNKIKIIFLGYDYLGGQFLQVLLNEYADKFEVVAVSTNATGPQRQPFSKKFKRTKILLKKNLFLAELKEKIFFGKWINRKLLKNPPPLYPDITVEQLAKKHNLPIINPSVIFTGDVATVDSYNADYIVIASFGKIPAAIYSNKPGKVVNFHPSFLPQLRGGSPVYSAIMRGQLQTGFSYHHLSNVFDAGPLLYQEPFEINNDYTSRQAEIIMSIAGANKLYELLTGLQNNTIAPIDITGREITKCLRNYEINPLLQPGQHTTASLLRKIKAFCSWPLGASFIRKGFKHFYVTEAKAAQWPANASAQNMMYKEGDGLMVKTQDGAILISQVFYQKKYYNASEIKKLKGKLF